MLYNKWLPKLSVSLKNNSNNNKQPTHTRSTGPQNPQSRHKNPTH